MQTMQLAQQQFSKLQQHPTQQHRHRRTATQRTPLKCRNNILRIGCKGVAQRNRSKMWAYASLLPFAVIAASAPAASSSAPPAAVVAAVTAPHLPAILSSAGLFIICCAAAALMVAGIPLLWSLTRAANRLESMMQTLEMELPDTAASIRLSTLELSDCMSELGALGNDVSSGVRAAAQLVSSAEAGVKQGISVVGSAVVPALARRETRVRDVLEAALKARATLAPQIPKARAAVASTTAAARKLRGGLMLTKLAVGIFDVGRAVRMHLTVAAAKQILQQQAAAKAMAAERGQHKGPHPGRRQKGSS